MEKTVRFEVSFDDILNHVVRMTDEELELLRNRICDEERVRPVIEARLSAEIVKRKEIYGVCKRCKRYYRSCCETESCFANDRFPGAVWETHYQKDWDKGVEEIRRQIAKDVWKELRKEKGESDEEEEEVRGGAWSP